MSCKCGGVWGHIEAKHMLELATLLHCSDRIVIVKIALKLLDQEQVAVCQHQRSIGANTAPKNKLLISRQNLILELIGI